MVINPLNCKAMCYPEFYAVFRFFTRKYLTNNNINHMKKCRLLILLFLFSCFQVHFCSVANAQDSDSRESKWYVGVGSGIRFGNMMFSELDEKVFPNKEMLSSGLFSVFVERNFGKNGNFGIRPEITYLKRGGKLTGIYSKKKLEDEKYYNLMGIEDISYSLIAHYLDIRLPIFFQFGNYSSVLRPYIYAAPIIGFPLGGEISVEQHNLSGHYAGYELALNKANITGYHVAAAIGAGVKWNLNINGKNVYLGLDASYKFGLTDTYGKKEKNGEAITKDLFYNAYNIKGSRKFGGFELMATIGIPLGKKKAKPVIPVPQPVVIDTIKTEPVVEEKPCYSLEEIDDMIKNGENVYGKTFCAINAIHFEFGKSTIKQNSYEYLDELTRILIETGIKIEVKGHTDNVGSEEYNLKLSRARAEAVVEYLANKGVNKEHLSYSYYGMSRPLADNSTEHGRKINRRVEFEILK